MGSWASARILPALGYLTQVPKANNVFRGIRHFNYRTHDRLVSRILGIFKLVQIEVVQS